jgi:hypothetical protein
MNKKQSKAIYDYYNKSISIVDKPCDIGEEHWNGLVYDGEHWVKKEIGLNINGRTWDGENWIETNIFNTLYYPSPTLVNPMVTTDNLVVNSFDKTTTDGVCISHNTINLQGKVLMSGSNDGNWNWTTTDNSYCLQDKISMLESKLESVTKQLEEGNNLTPIEKLKRKVNNFSLEK